MKKILIVRLDNIGDNILNSAFLREFYRNVKNKSNAIDVLVRPNVYPIIKNTPYADNIHISWANHPNITDHQVNRYVDFLENYDWIVLPRWGGDNPTVKSLYKLKKSIRVSGFSTCVNRTQYDCNDILTDCFHRNEIEHFVTCSMKFLNYLGYREVENKVECWPDTYDAAVVDSVLRELNYKYVCVFIGATCKERVWGLENFKVVINYIKNELNTNVLLIGGTDVENKGNEIVSKLIDESGVINVSGRVDLKDTYELIKRSSCILSNDSGPAHLASTTNTPVIVMYREGYVPDNLPLCYSEPSRYHPYCEEYYCITPIFGSTGMEYIDINEVCDAVRYVIR